MVSVQTSRFHLRLEASAPRARPAWPCSSVSKLPPSPVGLGPLVPGPPPGPRPLLHHGGAPVSVLSHQLAFSFLCSFLNWYLWHTRGQGRTAPCTRESLPSSFPLVCLPSPARTTGISPGFHPSQPEWALYALTLGQVAEPLCTHTHTLCPEMCFFKPTDLHSPISQPSKCRMPLVTGLPTKTCFLGRLLCPRAARLCPAFVCLCQHSQAPLRLGSCDTTSVRPPGFLLGDCLHFPTAPSFAPNLRYLFISINIW